MVSQTRVDASSAYASDISDDEWYLYYEFKFSSLDLELEQLYEAKPEEMLAVSQHTHFVVTTKSVEKAIYQLKQKSSSGIDYVSAMHLKHGGFLLIEHITLLMQMIFTQCKVPTTFCFKKSHTHS